VIFSTTTRHCW